MRTRRALAAAVATATLAAAVGMLAAVPASADDHGALIPGTIYLFNAQVNLDTATNANLVSSGGGNQFNQWKGLAVDTLAPAGTTNIQEFVRIPNGNPDPNQWDEISAAPYSLATDAEGRFYSYSDNQGFAIGTVQSYLNSHGHTGDFKLIVVAQDDDANSLGYWSTDVTISNSAAADPLGTDITWTVTTPPSALTPRATSTSLDAPAATDVDTTTAGLQVYQGDAVSLTAHVSPAAATGDVEFFSGAQSLGTAAVSGGVATLASSAFTSSLPVGADSITAKFVGTADYAASPASNAEAIDVLAVPDRHVTVTVDATPTSGAPYQPVVLHAQLTNTDGNGTPAGQVTLLVDGNPVYSHAAEVNAGDGANQASVSFTDNFIGGGDHVVTATFAGNAPYVLDGTPNTVSLSFSSVASDDQTVIVTIPAGAITITTPYTDAAPLDLGTATLDESDATYSASAPFDDIVIKDTRSGNLGFTASVVSGPFQSGTDSFGGNYAGLTGLAATQVSGNALVSTDVVLTDHAPFTDGLGSSKVFATYAPGLPIGTAHIDGVFGIDQVPTSVTPGIYKATVTFTA
ncbi:MAG TPA: Ig-like domain-containing protein, partial [Rugosimonospora sp.]|nr:Ig-like domain-containing protein [Rugosimonospora sp.]